MRHLGASLVEADPARPDDAPFSYRELAGEPDSLRYLLTARDGGALRQEVEGWRATFEQRLQACPPLVTVYAIVATTALNAAEFMARNPARLGPTSAVILCSHSGTTPETVEAARFARSKGALTPGTRRRLPR